MKKLAYSILALAAVLSVSCNKEQEAPVAPSTSEKHTVSIKAAIAPGTRTSYENDKTFSWKKGDVVQVMTISADESYLRIEDFTAESDGPETILTGEVEEGYTLYGIAFYTAADSYVAFGGENDGNIYVNMPSFTYIDGDNTQYYTAQSANPLANLPLTGFENEDGTYFFQTASGAAKFTIEDIPEGAAYFAIEGSSVALSGQFALAQDGTLNAADARIGSYTYTGSDGQEHTSYYSSRYIVYHFDRQADGKGTIYMPLPIGEIPAGATVSFYDDELENVLYTRPIRTAIPIERNKVTEVATFSASYEWESMGTGAFYDLPVFYYMTAEDDRENDEILYHMSMVEFFQDKNVPGVYRFENPYKAAAEYRGYTIDEEFAKDMDDYLTITILKDGTIIYDDFYTGYKYNSTSGGTTADVHPFAACPGNWGDDNSFNFVAKYNADGVPTNAFLSSLYLYAKDGGYYYWNWPDSWSYMWTTILFPDAEEQLDLNCSVSMTEIADDTPAHPTAKVELSLGDDLVGAYLVIAPDKETAEEMIAAGKGTYATETGSFVAPFPEDAPTGSYFAYAKTVPAEGLTENCGLLFVSEDEFDYFRTDMDRQLTMEDIVGSYTASNYYFTFKQYRVLNYGWTSQPETLTMVIEESDNPLSGDIMFTDICPEVVKSFAGKKVTASPIYGWFDTATGVITIDPGQTAYTASSNYYTVSNIDGEEVSLYLKEPGVVFCKNNIAFMQNGEMNEYDMPEAWTNTETTFTRDGSSSAPALAPARRQAETKSKAGHSAPSIVNPFSARRPLDEDVPFLGFRETLINR